MGKKTSSSGTVDIRIGSVEVVMLTERTYFEVE